VILTNPSAEQIESFFNSEILELDRLLLTTQIAIPGLRKVVFEYSDKGLELKFGVRSDAVPVSIRRISIEEFKNNKNEDA
jgi:hypothetical protein